MTPSAHVSSVRILLVDDDEDDVILTRAMFAEVQDIWAQVDWSARYDESLEKAVAGAYDLHLVDYRIGPESGIAWLREAQRRGVRGPVILLTGQGSHEVDLEAMQAGAADYLVKGRLDAAQLGRSVRYALDRRRYLARIEASEERYRLLFERSPLPMWVYDIESLRFLAVNDAAVAHYGYSREEFLALTPRDIRPPSEVPHFEQHLKDRQHGLWSGGLWKHRRKDGSIIDVEVAAHDIELDGHAGRLILVRDVTEQLRLDQQKRLLVRALESSKSGIIITDALQPDLPITYVNPAFQHMTGFSQEELIGHNCRFLQGEDRNQEGIQQIRDALTRQGDCEVVLRNYRKDGTLFWNQIRISPVRDGEGRLTHYIGVSQDLTDRRRYEAELAYALRHDPVTQLPRFVDAEDAFQSAIEAAGQCGECVAVYYIDVDRFHTVNDSVGRRGGDETLRLIAQRLRAAAPDETRIWRLGGDEFMLMVRLPADSDPFAIAERLRQTLEMPVPLSSYQLFLSGTVGFACYPENAQTATDLFNCAQAAISRAKRSGRSSVQAFSNTHAEELHERLALGGRLRSAIRDNELVLHFQPQVRAPDGRIVGMEALVRWQTRDLGLLPPRRFVGVAEELGMIVELGRWVLRNACKQARAWLEAGHDDVSVAVNVSALQLHRLTFIDEVREALQETGLPPSMLELELTETAIMDNVQRASQIMAALKEIGVGLALDDFGVGYSSLSHLSRFPINKLKIDHSFIHDVALESGEAAIARAITAMGHELRMTVMAEGVETEAQLGYLLRNHCDEFQGHVFGPAVPADQAMALLRGRFIESVLMSASQIERGLLLVDDEDNVLRALNRLLRREGYSIFTANNVQQGFDILARNKIQVIVSDQRMPDISGTEFLSKVKEMYPDTVRLVLSGYTDLATVTSAINRGAIYKFLTKPWDDDDLRAQISEAFRTYSERMRETGRS